MTNRMPVAVDLQKNGMKYIIPPVTVVKDFGILREVNVLLNRDIIICFG